MSVQVGRSVFRRGLARYFDLARWDTDLPTEIRAGVTTFMVMAWGQVRPRDATSSNATTALSPMPGASANG